ncbi:MAG: hypothetical protein AB7V43_11060 [Acidimicrobiia bacterium]
MLVLRHQYTVKGVYCRDCGLAVGRDSTNKTLITGWWGLLSFFTNLAFVAGAVGELRRLRRLERPANGTRPSMSPGPSLLARPGPVFSVCVFGLLAVYLTGHLSLAGSTSGESVAAPAPAASSRATKHSGPPQQLTVRRNDLTWQVRGCVHVMSTSAGLVDCTGPFDAMVVQLTDDPANCAVEVEYFVHLSSGVACIRMLPYPYVPS